MVIEKASDPVEMTSEENQKLREEVAREIEAEESGEPSPDYKPEAESLDGNPPKDDPWAGVSPALKSMFDDMSTRVKDFDNTQTRLKQAELRIGSITNELSAAKKAAVSVALAPTKEQMAVAAKSEEKWEELKADFPEWGEATDLRISTKLNALRSELIGKLQADPAVRSAEIERLKTTLGEGMEEQVQRGVLSFFHPDWEKKVASKDYAEWIKSQPEEIVKMHKSSRAIDAAEVLTAFDAFRGTSKTAAEITLERQRRLKSSVNPPGGKSTPIKSDADLSEAELRIKIGNEVFAEI